MHTLWFSLNGTANWLDVFTVELPDLESARDVFDTLSARFVALSERP